MKRPSKTKIARRRTRAKGPLPPFSNGGKRSSPVSNGENGQPSEASPPVSTGKVQGQPQSGQSAPLKLALENNRDPKVLMVERAGNETEEDTNARMMLAPAVTDSVVLRMFSQPALPSHIDATLSASVMAERIAAVNSGDLTGLVGMLTSKAIALDAVANEFLRRASLNMGAHLQATETYVRMALKSQAQSRACIEAIAEIKNPRPVFARQTNIAAGPQQVNNSPAPTQLTRQPDPLQLGHSVTEQIDFKPSKILENLD